MSPSATLPVAEIFGPTFQGEGPSTGRLAAFVRLGGCNLTCRGCDTPYTWDASRYRLREQMTALTPQDILARVPDAPLTVVTGGEPLLYQRRPAMAQMLDGLLAGRDVEIETNGTLAPGPALLERPVRFNVSPKLGGPMSVDPAARRIVPAALDRFAELAAHGRAVFKLVVANPRDVDAAVLLLDAHQVPRNAAWLMPEGTTPETMLGHARAVADAALAAGLNLTLRAHVLLWPTTERGR